MICLYKTHGAVSCVGAYFLFIKKPSSQQYQERMWSCADVTLYRIYWWAVPIQTATHSYDHSLIWWQRVINSIILTLHQIAPPLNHAIWSLLITCRYMCLFSGQNTIFTRFLNASHVMLLLYILWQCQFIFMLWEETLNPKLSAFFVSFPKRMVIVHSHAAQIWKCIKVNKHVCAAWVAHACVMTLKI